MAKSVIKIGIILTILNLVGCSGKTKKVDENLSKDYEEKITKSIEDYKNKQSNIKLTEQIIDTTSDNNLLQLVFDNLAGKQSTNSKNEYETVMSWNKSKQAIYMIWELESEVNNGGYNQFYFNSSGQFYKYLPDALKLVGANKFASLTKRANETFEKENANITKHQDGTLEGFSKSYENNPLNKFDDMFYELYKTENLEQLQIDYIRKHKAEFIEK